MKKLSLNKLKNIKFRININNIQNSYVSYCSTNNLEISNILKPQIINYTLKNYSTNYNSNDANLIEDKDNLELARNILNEINNSTSLNTNKIDQALILINKYPHLAPDSLITKIEILLLPNILSFDIESFLLVYRVFSFNNKISDTTNRLWFLLDKAIIKNTKEFSITEFNNILYSISIKNNKSNYFKIFNILCSNIKLQLENNYFTRNTNNENNSNENNNNNNNSNLDNNSSSLLAKNEMFELFDNLNNYIIKIKSKSNYVTSSNVLAFNYENNLNSNKNNSNLELIYDLLHYLFKKIFENIHFEKTINNLNPSDFNKNSNKKWFLLNRIYKTVSNSKTESISKEESISHINKVVKTIYLFHSLDYNFNKNELIKHFNIKDNIEKIINLENEHKMQILNLKSIYYLVILGFPYLENIIIKNIELFTPYDLNILVQLINKNKFYSEQFKDDLNNKYEQLLLNDISSMNITELLSYLNTTVELDLNKSLLFILSNLVNNNSCTLKYLDLKNLCDLIYILHRYIGYSYNSKDKKLNDVLILILKDNLILDIIENEFFNKYFLNKNQVNNNTYNNADYTYNLFLNNSFKIDFQYFYLILFNYIDIASVLKDDIIIDNTAKLRTCNKKLIGVFKEINSVSTKENLLNNYIGKIINYLIKIKVNLINFINEKTNKLELKFEKQAHLQ